MSAPHPSILSQMKSVIVGTAGHIDHGKTALVKALTGIDADRLEEEKRRGITIDIGFAHFELPTSDGSRIRLGFVDVPGHERFVRNMLAGVGGIDLVLLVIAADEGIKPQTQNLTRWMRRRSKWCDWKWKISCAGHFSTRLSIRRDRRSSLLAR